MRTFPLLLSATLGLVLGACGGGGSSDDPTIPAAPIALQDAPCSEYDSGKDGTVDSVYQYTYDGDGFLTGWTTGDYVATYTYGQKHFLSNYGYTMAGTQAYSEVYTRDADNRVTHYVETSSDQVIDETMTYDGEGRLTRDVEVTTPTGMPAQTVTVEYTYGDDFHEQSSITTNADGSQTKGNYLWSNGFKNLTVGFDQGVDGTVDVTVDVVFDDDRNILSQIRTEGTTVTQKQTFAYDSRGVQTHATLDYDGDGSDDYNTSFTFTGGMLTHYESESPSGMFTQYIDQEDYKDTCQAPATRQASGVPAQLKMAPGLAYRLFRGDVTLTSLHAR